MCTGKINEKKTHSADIGSEVVGLVYLWLIINNAATIEPQAVILARYSEDISSEQQSHMYEKKHWL